jgi:hypothetical protein
VHSRPKPLLTGIAQHGTYVRRPREIWMIGICGYASQPVDPRST